MTERVDSPTDHQIYPIRYFVASPTWFVWNKLTAANVHALREERGFEGQHIYFHLNHPIKFVCLVGVVAGIDIIGQGKHILISLDDSSGACIEVKLSFRDVRKGDNAEYPSNTTVDNVDVHTTLGETAVLINEKPIQVGTVIKAKGTLDSFREVRQLKLERVWILKSTNEEVNAWTETTKWKREVLSKPWILPEQRRDEIDEQIRQDTIKEREKSRKSKAWDTKYAEKKKRLEEKIESRRRRHEERFNTGALKGSNTIPTRFTDS